MTFPVYIHLFGYAIHPHPLFEGLGYFCGARLYFYQRRADPKPPLGVEPTAWLFLGCVFGGLLGSKLLAWIESPEVYWAHRAHLAVFVAGKTIVGGLLGGWAGIELTKRCLRLRSSTGDAFVFPLLLGTALGRIGCFLTGLDDDTYGTPTRLPWGVDFGDQIARHPTQLYEIGFVLLFGVTLWSLRRRLLVSGELFRLYMIGYLSFRFLIEFIKPRHLYFAGLSAIQMAAAIGTVFSLVSWRRLRSPSSIQ